MSVSEVAFLLGFSAPAAFSGAFGAGRAPRHATCCEVVTRTLHTDNDLVDSLATVHAFITQTPRRPPGIIDDRPKNVADIDGGMDIRSAGGSIVAVSPGLWRGIHVTGARHLSRHV